MRPFTIIGSIACIILCMATTSCDSQPMQPSKILGAFDVDSTHIDFGDGTNQWFFQPNTERLVFTGDSIQWYYNTSDGYVHTGSVKATYVDFQLVKMGCRTVLSMDETHMSSTQDDWVITRYFH